MHIPVEKSDRLDRTNRTRVFAWYVFEYGNTRRNGITTRESDGLSINEDGNTGRLVSHTPMIPNLMASVVYGVSAILLTDPMDLTYRERSILSGQKTVL